MEDTGHKHTFGISDMLRTSAIIVGPRLKEPSSDWKFRKVIGTYWKDHQCELFCDNYCKNLNSFEDAPCKYFKEEKQLFSYW